MKVPSLAAAQHKPIGIDLGLDLQKTQISRAFVQQSEGKSLVLLEPDLVLRNF